MKRPGAYLAAALTTLLPFVASHASAETLAVFTKSAGNPIAKAVRAGVEQVAKKNGFTVFHYIPTSADNPRQQTALVDEALSTKPDAIIFTPVDIKAMVPAVQKINAANVPLVNISDRLTGGNAVSFIGTDDYSIAVETARTLFKAMGGKGNLVVLEGPDNVPTAIARLRGFKDALKEFPNIKVTLSKNGMYARPPVLDLFKSMPNPTPPPRVRGFLPPNDPLVFGETEPSKTATKPLPPIVGI